MTDFEPYQIKYQDFNVLGNENFQQQLDMALALIAENHNISTSEVANRVINFVLVSTATGMTNLDTIEHWRIFYRNSE